MNPVDALARDGAPTLAALPRALSATNALLVDSQPSLRRASRTLALAGSAVTPTLKLLQSVQPALPDIDKSVANLLPTVSYLAPRYCELSNAFTGWSEIQKRGTSYNNVTRFNLVEPGNLIAGGTGSPLVPTFPNSTRLAPYPGPCVNGQGEAAPPRITAEESAKGLTYTAQHPEQGPAYNPGNAP